MVGMAHGNDGCSDEQFIKRILDEVDAETPGCESPSKKLEAGRHEKPEGTVKGQMSRQHGATAQETARECNSRDCSNLLGPSDQTMCGDCRVRYAREQQSRQLGRGGRERKTQRGRSRSPAVGLGQQGGRQRTPAGGSHLHLFARDRVVTYRVSTAGAADSSARITTTGNATTRMRTDGAMCGRSIRSG